MAGKDHNFKFLGHLVPTLSQGNPDVSRLLYRADGLEIIGVAIDKKEDVADFIDTLFIDYPVLIGGTEMMAMMRRYGNRVGSLPYNVLIDRDGTILGTKKGAYTHAELEALLTPLFKKD